jgi:hypothetical protein
VTDDDEWDDILSTGAIVLGGAVILDEIFDDDWDDNWNGYWDGNGPGGGNQIDWSGDITIDNGINIGNGQIDLGNVVATGRVGESDTDSTTGRYEMGVNNEVCGTLYRYARIYTDCTGAIATGINFTVRGVQKA